MTTEELIQGIREYIDIRVNVKLRGDQKFLALGKDIDKQVEYVIKLVKREEDKFWAVYKRQFSIETLKRRKRKKKRGKKTKG